MNVLICFDNNDYLVTRINCTLEEAKEYYLEKSFTYWDDFVQQEAKRIVKYVIDTDENFNVSYTNNVIEPMDYIFRTTNYSECGYDIVLLNQTRNEDTEIEPNWFWKSSNRVIKQ